MDTCQRTGHSAFVARAEAVVLSLVTPSARGIVETIRARVVATAKVGYRDIGLTWTLLEMGGPVHALAIGKGGQVSISVHAHLHVLTPHAHGAGTVGTRLT